MKIRLVFEKWKNLPFSINNSGLPEELYYGHFHGGTTWNGTIEVSAEEWLELQGALERGYKPVFEVTK